MPINRRRMMRLLGVAAFGGLAGCGSDGSSTDTPMDTPTETPTDRPAGTPTDTPTRTPTDTPTGTPTDTPTETPTDTPGDTPTGGSGSLSQVTKLLPDDGDEEDKFGSAIGVSADGATALVGAERDEDPRGDTAGSAYVFSGGDSWSQEAKLAAPDGDPDDLFGSAADLSADGSVALLGAFLDEDPNGDFAGSAYVFSAAGGSWSQQAKLSAGDGDSGDWFARSVALSDDGTTAVVGAPRDEDPNGENAGSAYVFSAAGGSWSQQTKLVPDDGDSNDQFGWSVGLSGDGTTALVGASANDFAGDEDPNGEFAGSSYVFTESGGSWSQQTKLVPDDGDEDDHFGNDVALSTDGNTALVGAFWDDDPITDLAGSAYVFRRSGGSWSREAKLAAADGDKDDLFGSSVALSDDGTVALVGAEQDEHPNGNSAGSAYLFAESDGTWSQVGKMAAEDGDNGDKLGIAVGIAGDGTTPIVGAFNDEDPHGTRGGSAYVFER